MKLTRDSIIYKRIEKLEIYEKRKAIEEEFHCRDRVNMYCMLYDVDLTNYQWKPPTLNDDTRKILNTFTDHKQKYFKSILLLGDWCNKGEEKGVFTIEKEIFANFGHIPDNDDMGDVIDKLNAKECREYATGIWWDSERKAILRPHLKLGSYHSGVNINNYYIEFSTGMTKEEAQSFAHKAIEELYENNEKYKSEMGDIDFLYSISDFEDEKITNTNWADMLFIYDFIELYSEDGIIKEELLNEIHEELLKYHDYDYTKIKQVGKYSHSHVRSWVAKIRKEIKQS